MSFVFKSRLIISLIPFFINGAKITCFSNSFLSWRQKYNSVLSHCRTEHKKYIVYMSNTPKGWWIQASIYGIPWLLFQVDPLESYQCSVALLLKAQYHKVSPGE